MRTTKRVLGASMLVLLTGALLVAPACKSSRPKLSAADAADKIANHLVDGQRKEADAIYSDVKGSNQHRDAVYATVYDRSSWHYERQDYGAAVRLLEFLREHYPKANAVREALLYVYMLERSGKPEVPGQERLDAMEELLEGVAENEPKPPVWIDLVAAQVAIDRNRIDRARSDFARFQARWDGMPPSLRPYVLELERYLTSHPGGEG